MSLIRGFAERRIAASARRRPPAPLETWRGWARSVEGGAIACGHFLPEEAPGPVADAFLRFFSP